MPGGKRGSKGGDRRILFPQMGDHLVWVFRNICNLTPQEIGDNIGVSRNTVMGYLSGRNIPRRPQQLLLVKFAKEYIEKLKGDEKTHAATTHPRFITYNLAVIALLEESIVEYQRIDTKDNKGV